MNLTLIDFPLLLCSLVIGTLFSFCVGLGYFVLFHWDEWIGKTGE